MEKTAHRTEFVEGDALQTISRLSRLDEPPGQPIRHHELRGILAQHLQWLVSDKAAGRQADLSGAQLEEIDLTGADLEYAVMRKTNLGGADLFRAQLQHALLAQANLARANLLSAELCWADLQGANFEGAAGLIFSQLAGANLRGAVLPTSMSESGAAAHVHQLAKRVATMLVALLSLCVLAMARIVTTTDIQLIRNSSAVPVLHLGNALPMMAFFLVTPVVLVGLCIALHLRLLRLWEAVEASPAVFPSGRRLANCGPWIVMALGFDQFKWIRGHSAVLSRFESAGKRSYGGISRAGSETLRWILLQVARVAARYSPAACAWYQRLRRRKRPQVAKVALARKLLNYMWALLHHGVCYDDQIFAA